LLNEGAPPLPHVPQCVVEIFHIQGSMAIDHLGTLILKTCRSSRRCRKGGGMKSMAQIFTSEKARLGALEDYTRHEKEAAVESLYPSPPSGLYSRKR
jgi:hypothetical protein